MMLSSHEPHSRRATRAAKIWRALQLFCLFAVPTLIMFFVGCNKTVDTEPVDYGPETSATAINAEIAKPLAKQDPNDVHVGQFFHDVTTQDIAQGAAMQVSGESGYTVIDRQDAGDIVRLIIEEHQYSYKSDGSYDKLTTQHDLFFRKLAQTTSTTTSTTNTTGTNTTTDAADTALSLQAEQIRNSAIVLARSLNSYIALSPNHARAQDLTTSPTPSASPDASPTASPTASPAPSPSASPSATPTPAPTAAAVTQTYHRLRTWTERIPAPESVRARTNCTGIPDCLIEAHHISYNIVSWESAGPVLIQVEHVLSPTAPYFAAQMQTCATMLVPIGTTGSKVLLRQCKTVVDFCFDDNNCAAP